MYIVCILVGSEVCVGVPQIINCTLYHVCIDNYKMYKFYYKFKYNFILRFWEGFRDWLVMCIRCVISMYRGEASQTFSLLLIILFHRSRCRLRFTYRHPTQVIVTLGNCHLEYCTMITHCLLLAVTYSTARHLPLNYLRS